MPSTGEPIVTAGTVEEGLANARRLLESHPEVALQQAETLLKLGPDPRALRLAAAAHRKLGNVKRAEAAEIVAIEASLPNPRLKAAALAENEGRSEEASALAAQFLREQPDDLLALTISAEAGVSARRLTRAEEILRHVLSRAPQFMRAAMMLAKCLLLQSRLPDAIAALEEVLKRKPNHGIALRLHARLLSDIREYDRAAAIFERLIAMDDREIDLWINYAATLRFMGRRQDAELAFRRALSMDAGHGGAWWGLADLSPGSITDRDLAAIREALAERSGDLIEATNLLFALALALDHREAHAEAFPHFAEGNAGRLRVFPYYPADTTEEVDQSTAIFTRQYFDRYQGAGARDTAPIFIVGMPRSGSTMIERILGRHSRVEPAGELPIMPRLVEQLTAEAGGARVYRDKLRRLERGQVKELGEAYLNRSRAFRKTGKPRFTDKLHMNWRHLGLIHLILPNARIIDVRRNAIDCCWSNFKTQFAAGHPASNDLGHIGLFYRDYVRFMDHMVSVAPDRILPVRYESVVDDIEGETRRMLDFLGLDFEPQCLDFHLSDQPVATASSEQVRQPLNRQGIDASRPYAQWLGPLREALGPLADA
jgi:tetratricopeptide (TPR) repeat protein